MRNLSIIEIDAVSGAGNAAACGNGMLAAGGFAGAAGAVIGGLIGSLAGPIGAGLGATLGFSLGAGLGGAEAAGGSACTFGDSGAGGGSTGQQFKHDASAQ